MRIRSTVVRKLAVAAGIVGLFLPALAMAGEISIDVAPNTLNIRSDGQVVTVHTDLSFGAVDVSTVYLNGIAISSWKADNRGNFVAKFLMEEVKTLDGLVIDGYNLLQIVGLTEDDEPFWGEQEIMVIDRGRPSGRTAVENNNQQEQ